MNRTQVTEDLSYSRIVYGMWRLTDDSDTRASHVQAKIEACLEQGITTIDQADIYGGYQAEEVFGQALKAAPQLKDNIEVVTKCGILVAAGRHERVNGKHYDTSRQHIESSVNASLKLMNIERIDTLLIHRPDPFMDHEETGAKLDALIASGKVRSAGVSNFEKHDWDLLQSAMSEKLVTNQIELSLAAFKGFSNGQVANLQAAHVPIMAWSPLGGGGLLTEKSAVKIVLERIAQEQNVTPSAVAVAWLLAHPAKIVPVMGTNNLDRIGALSQAFSVNLTRKLWFELYSAAQGFEVP